MAIQHSSNRDARQPADNTKTLPFECTYPNCIKRFATEKEMKLHKKGAEDHYYCKKCDVDCEDWDELTQVNPSAPLVYVMQTQADNLSSTRSSPCLLGWMVRCEATVRCCRSTSCASSAAWSTRLSVHAELIVSR